MAYEQRDNSGSLFKNDKKTTEKHPDYTGDCMINGVKLRMAAWIKEGARGKFMSVSFSVPQSESRQAPPREIADDDLPF